MRSFEKLILWVTLLLQFSPVQAAAPISLTPRDVADRILKQSFQAQEINLQAQEDRIILANVEQLFDFQLSADYGYQDSKFASSTQSYLLENKSLISNLILAKPFPTGTTLSLQWTGTSDNPSYSSTAPTAATDITNNSIGLVLQQNLWRNFFGEANQADLRSARATLKASSINRVSSLQDLVLQGIQAYWSAYVAQETFQEAVNSRDRYLKLVDSIKKKTSYGYANPGELAQAQAELEGREQNVKAQSVSYLAAIDQLITLLRLPPQSEIKFVVSEDLPQPPVTSPINHEKLRPVQASNLRLQAAEESLRSAQSKSHPDLSLVGKYYAQGYDPSSSEANRQLTSGSHPKYYVGVQVQYNFGSGYQQETITNRRAARDLASTQLQRQKLELQDQENNIRRNIQSTFAIAQSANNQKSLREKAVQQLTRSYTQGRTDIAILIDALNKYFDSEVQLTRAVGNYQIALIQWEAFQDQLVRDQKSNDSPSSAPY